LKIILSRKGFDSAAGKTASPILPNGTYVSLPIPDERSSIRYKDISWNGGTLGTLVEHLSNGLISSTDRAHLDPDLRTESLKERAQGWRGLFGQVGSAQGHLSRFVEPGDLFIYFGWFKHVTMNPDGECTYSRNSPDMHVLFGWLQVETIFALRPNVAIPEWATYHPHCVRGFSKQNNTLYIASRDLVLGDTLYPDRGFGVFTNYKQEYCLTCPNQPNRSVWKLPRWFYPFTKDRSPLTYHSDSARWQLQEEAVLLRTAGRGQEFIIDCLEYPEAIGWARNLITR